MRKSTITAIAIILAVSQVTFLSCNKADRERAKMEAHQREMIKRSFEKSKETVAARVNGETITMFALLREMNVIGPQYLARGVQKTPELDAKVRKDALRNVIFQELAVQEAKKRGMKVSPETIDNGIKKIKASAGSEDAFRQYLANNDLTEDELRKITEQDALFEMIATREIDDKIKVTDAAVRARYQKEKAGLKDANHKQMTYESAKGLIEQKIRAEAAEKRMSQWEKELKKNARIEIVAEKLKQG